VLIGPRNKTYMKEFGNILCTFMSGEGLLFSHYTLNSVSGRKENLKIKFA